MLLNLARTGLSGMGRDLSALQATGSTPHSRIFRSSHLRRASTTAAANRMGLRIGANFGCEISISDAPARLCMNDGFWVTAYASRGTLSVKYKVTSAADFSPGYEPIHPSRDSVWSSTLGGRLVIVTSVSSFPGVRVTLIISEDDGVCWRSEQTGASRSQCQSPKSGSP